MQFVNFSLCCQVSLTAAHCARTLIAASASGNVLLRCCVKLLMPALIEYIAKMVPLVNDGSISENHATAISEVWKAFAIFFGSLTEGARKFTVNFKVLQTITSFSQGRGYWASSCQQLVFSSPTPKILLPPLSRKASNNCYPMPRFPLPHSKRRPLS